MEENGGGWLVFQRRFDGSVSFAKTWEEYKHGFGDVENEHWLGNKWLNLLTKSEVRVVNYISCRNSLVFQINNVALHQKNKRNKVF